MYWHIHTQTTTIFSCVLTALDNESNTVKENLPAINLELHKTPLYMHLMSLKQEQKLPSEYYIMGHFLVSLFKKRIFE